MAEKKVKKKKKAKNPKKDKEEVCEIFELKKGRKEKVVKACGEEIVEHASKEQLKKQNNLLRNVLIAMGLFVIFCVLLVWWIDSTRSFEYNGLKFKVVKEGNLILYQTSLPVYYQGELRQYNFYLRNDPRKLEDVNFDGDVRLLKNMVVNMSDIRCDGDEVIGVANLVKLWNVLGTKVITDENATCDPQGRYIYLNILEGNDTQIQEDGTACYEMTVGNCEILRATEKFMVETLIEVNRVQGRSSPD